MLCCKIVTTTQTLSSSYAYLAVCHSANVPCMLGVWCQVSCLKQDLQVKEKQYEVRLQAIEDSHRQSTLELREMLTAQQQMSAKYAFHCRFLLLSALLLCVLYQEVADSTLCHLCHFPSRNNCGQVVDTRVPLLPKSHCVMHCRLNETNVLLAETQKWLWSSTTCYEAHNMFNMWTK